LGGESMSPALLVGIVVLGVLFVNYVAVTSPTMPARPSGWLRR
jgi:hypothetical protein